MTIAMIVHPALQSVLPKHSGPRNYAGWVSQGSIFTGGKILVILPRPYTQCTRTPSIGFGRWAPIFEIAELNPGALRERGSISNLQFQFLSSLICCGSKLGSESLFLGAKGDKRKGLILGFGDITSKKKLRLWVIFLQFACV